MDGKWAKLRRAYFDVFLKDKIMCSFRYVFLTHFRFVKNVNGTEHYASCYLMRADLFAITEAPSSKDFLETIRVGVHFQ